MPKATRIAASIPVSSTSPNRSDDHPLVSIGLFSATGLLVSLVAAIMGVQVGWY